MTDTPHTDELGRLAKARYQAFVTRSNLQFTEVPDWDELEPFRQRWEMDYMAAALRELVAIYKNHMLGPDETVNMPVIVERIIAQEKSDD